MRWIFLFIFFGWKLMYLLAILQKVPYLTGNSLHIHLFFYFNGKSIVQDCWTRHSKLTWICLHKIKIFFTNIDWIVFLCIIFQKQKSWRFVQGRKHTKRRILTIWVLKNRTKKPIQPMFVKYILKCSKQIQLVLECLFRKIKNILFR